MTKAFSMFLWQNSPSVNTPLGESKLNLINTALNEVDSRVVNFDTTKANQTDLLTAVADVTYNESTGVFTVTKKNGSKTTIDTKLEKLAINFTYDSINQQLVIHLSDGTYQYVDLKALITELEFLNSDTVLFSVTNGKVTANIAQGSITADMLEPNYLANVQLCASQALQSAESAEESARNAEESALRAKEEADRAEAIVGGDFATNEKVDKIIDGTTTVGNADKLDGLHANEIADGTNLLVNPDFAITTNGADASGWDLIRASLTRNEDGSITLTRTGATTQSAYIRRRFPKGASIFKGKTVTASFEDTNGKKYEFTFAAEGVKSKTVGDIQIFYDDTASTFNGDSQMAFGLAANSNAQTLTIKWAKLELGKQATPFVPPNKDVEEIKIGHYVKVYKSLSELGLTEATATAESIVNAMADNSMLLHKLSGTATSATLQFPYNYSMFRVTKLNTSYASFECIGTDSALIQYGYYNGGSTNKWSGWSTKFLPLTGGKLTGDLKLEKHNNGYGTIVKNHSATADYGTELRDYTASGSKAVITALASTQKARFTNDSGSYELFHTGNSQKVTISDTAPTDGLWVVP